MAERLQWALRHEKWSVATWAKGAWTSAAVLRMRYHQRWHSVCSRPGTDRHRTEIYQSRSGRTAFTI